jgi:hypothetical protein
MTYDPTTATLLLFGGDNHTTSTEFGDTWTWNGTTWTELSPSKSPSPRDGAGLAYDQRTGNVVLFGGEQTPTSDLADTWKWG